MECLKWEIENAQTDQDLGLLIFKTMRRLKELPYEDYEKIIELILDHPRAGGPLITKALAPEIDLRWGRIFNDRTENSSSRQDDSEMARDEEFLRRIYDFVTERMLESNAYCALKGMKLPEGYRNCLRNGKCNKGTLKGNIEFPPSDEFLIKHRKEHYLKMLREGTLFDKHKANGSYPDTIRSLWGDSDLWPVRLALGQKLLSVDASANTLIEGGQAILDDPSSDPNKKELVRKLAQKAFDISPQGSWTTYAFLMQHARSFPSFGDKAKKMLPTLLNNYKDNPPRRKREYNKNGHRFLSWGQERY